jgi:hypothetical protein
VGVRQISLVGNVDIYPNARLQCSANCHQAAAVVEVTRSLSVDQQRRGTLPGCLVRGAQADPRRVA